MLDVLKVLRDDLVAHVGEADAIRQKGAALVARVESVIAAAEAELAKVPTLADIKALLERM